MVGFAADLGGGYSLTPPENWVVQKSPASPYSVLIAQPVDDFSPNINIQEETYNGSMDDYISLSMVNLEQMMKAKKISQSPFSAANSKGVKLVTNTEYNDFKLRQTFYFFDNSRGQKVVVVTSSARSSAGQFDPVFDTIMQTFNVR